MAWPLNLAACRQPSYRRMRESLVETSMRRRVEEEREEAAPAVAEELVEQIEEALSPGELKKKVLSLIRKSKDEGIRLVTMAEALGLESWRTLVPVAQELITEGKVKKKGSVYSAT